MFGFCSTITRNLNLSLDSFQVSQILSIPAASQSAHVTVHVPGLHCASSELVLYEEQPSPLPALDRCQSDKSASVEPKPAYKRSTCPRPVRVTPAEMQCHSGGHFLINGLKTWCLRFKTENLLQTPEGSFLSSSPHRGTNWNRGRPSCSALTLHDTVTACPGITRRCQFRRGEGGTLRSASRPLCLGLRAVAEQMF